MNLRELKAPRHLNWMARCFGAREKLYQVKEKREKSLIIKFTIPGNPFGKQRPYFGNRRGFKRSKTTLHENLAREAWHQVYDGAVATWDVAIDLKAYYCIPKSWPKWKQKAALLGYIRPNKKGPKKPDVDNVSKLVMDSLNPAKVGHRNLPNTGIYEDDGQVVHLAIDSWYSDNPRVEVTVNALPMPDVEEIKKKVKEHANDCV